MLKRKKAKKPKKSPAKMGRPVYKEYHPVSKKLLDRHYGGELQRLINTGLISKATAQKFAQNGIFHLRPPTVSNLAQAFNCSTEQLYKKYL